MTQFTIIPGAGPDPLRFGMVPYDVEALLGSPSWQFRNPSGVLAEERANLHVNCGYSADGDKLDEAVFAMGARLIYEGKSLLDLESPVAFLSTYDRGYKWFDSVVFLNLGVMCTLIVNDDSTEWTVTVACNGHWDEYQSNFIDILPFHD